MCCSMTQGDVGHLVDAHDPQQAGDHGVHVAKADEFTLSLQRGENIEERAGTDKVDPAQAAAIHPDLATLGRESGEALEGVK